MVRSLSDAKNHDIKCSCDVPATEKATATDETNAIHLTHDCPTPGGVTLANKAPKSEITDLSKVFHPSPVCEPGATNAGGEGIAIADGKDHAPNPKDVSHAGCGNKDTIPKSSNFNNLVKPHTNLVMVYY